MKSEQLTVLDLFAGAGGMSKGFELAGFKVIAANENWEPAIKTFKSNHGNAEMIFGDINNGDIKKRIIDSFKGGVDLVIGGPPCQDFSSAGKRDGSGSRGNLTPIFAEVATKLRPRWVVMENVNTILSIGNKQLAECKKTLHESGYGITTTILNAADFEVPQKRKRMFLIARLGGKDDELSEAINAQRQQGVTVRQFMPEIASGKTGTTYYYRHARSYSRRAIFSIDEQSPTIRGVNRPIPKGYKFHKGDAIKDFSRVRPLTTMERARIQSFPKEYVWCGCKTDVEQQIGNAVPPLLAMKIAKAITEFESAGLKRFTAISSAALSRA
jgi:DNA (cytosine-5)-methyltransferase 1